MASILQTLGITKDTPRHIVRGVGDWCEEQRQAWFRAGGHIRDAANEWYHYGQDIDQMWKEYEAHEATAHVEPSELGWAEGPNGDEYEEGEDDGTQVC